MTVSKSKAPARPSPNVSQLARAVDLFGTQLSKERTPFGTAPALLADEVIMIRLVFATFLLATLSAQAQRHALTDDKISLTELRDVVERINAHGTEKEQHELAEAKIRAQASIFSVRTALRDHESLVRRGVHESFDPSKIAGDYNPRRFGQDMVIYLYQRFTRSPMNTTLMAELWPIFMTGNEAGKEALYLWLNDYAVGVDPALNLLAASGRLIDADPVAREKIHGQFGWIYYRDMSSLGFAMMSPTGKLLAYLSVDANLSPRLRELHDRVWSKIHAALVEASKYNPEHHEGESVEAKELDLSRRDVARRYLEEIKDTQEEWARQDAEGVTPRDALGLGKLMDAARGLKGYPPRAVPVEAHPSCEDLFVHRN